MAFAKRLRGFDLRQGDEPRIIASYVSAVADAATALHSVDRVDVQLVAEFCRSLVGCMRLFGDNAEVVEETSAALEQVLAHARFNHFTRIFHSRALFRVSELVRSSVPRRTGARPASCGRLSSCFRRSSSRTGDTPCGHWQCFSSETVQLRESWRSRWLAAYEQWSNFATAPTSKMYNGTWTGSSAHFCEVAALRSPSRVQHFGTTTVIPM